MALTNLQKLEIQRKAKLGQNLTNPNIESSSYYNQLKPNTSQLFENLLSASKQKTISNLDLTKQKALEQISQQQSQLTPQYEALRSQAAAQSMQQARNLAEYMAARGQTMSGLAAQSELSRGIGLTKQLGQIGQQQQLAQQDLANRKSMIEQDYLSKVANAQSDFELKQLEKAYTDAVKAEERAYQKQKTVEERIYQEGLKSQKLSSEKQQKKETQKQSDILNSVIDKIRKGEVYVQGIDIPGIGSLPSQTKKLTKEEIASGKYVDYIINNASQLRTNYGDAGYELLLKIAREEMKMNKPASSLSSVQYDPSTGQFAISQ